MGRRNPRRASREDAPGSPPRKRPAIPDCYAARGLRGRIACELTKGFEDAHAFTPPIFARRSHESKHCTSLADSAAMDYALRIRRALCETGALCGNPAAELQSAPRVRERISTCQTWRVSVRGFHRAPPKKTLLPHQSRTTSRLMRTSRERLEFATVRGKRGPCRSPVRRGIEASDGGSVERKEQKEFG